MKIDSYKLAEMLGISQATVSRAFSNPDKVSKKTREKIMELADTLGYSPDKNASALRRKGSGVIQLIYVKRDDGQYWTNVKRNYWIFAEAILALTSYFEEQPYTFEVKLVNSIFKVKSKEINSHCDGILVFDYVSEDEASYISEWNIPYVLCHRAIHLTKFNHSATDNYSGGQLQAKYLEDQGCTSPAYVMNEEDPFSHQIRRDGFLNIFPNGKVFNNSDSDEIIKNILPKWESGEIDGLAFVNDMLLVTIISKMFHRHYELQDKLPIIGYDNSTELEVLDKKPATISIGIGKIYKDAAEALISVIMGKVDNIHLVHHPSIVLNE